MAPAGIAAPVEMRMAWPSPSRLERRRACAGLADNAQPALGGTGENRVAVHRRARERRYVAGGLKVHRQHPVDGVADLDGLRAQRLDGSEHELAGLGDRK